MKIASTILILAAAAVSAFGQEPDDHVLKATVGKPMPAFRLTDTNGKVLSNSSLRGKVVLLDFWATWCAPCKRASPVMEQLHEKYGKKGLVVVGVQTLDPGSASSAKDYAKEHKYKYAFVPNNDDLSKKLSFPGIPVFMIIDKHGVVKRVETGIPSKFEEMLPSYEKTIKPLLAK